MDTQNPMPQSQPGGAAPGGQKNTTMAFLAYILFFIPLLTDAKNDPFVRFHVRQSLGLLIAWFITWTLGWYTPVPWSIVNLAQFALCVLWVIGVVYAFQGKQEPLPLVGPVFDKLKI